MSTNNYCKLNKIIYSLNLEEKTAGVESCDQNLQIINIPYSINYKSVEYIVTSILKQAFKDSYVKSIQFPPNSQIHKFGEELFANTFIKSMMIPSKLTTIEEKAFYKCSNLVEIEVPANPELRTIKQYAFSNSQIETLNFSANLVNLEKYWKINLI